VSAHADTLRPTRPGVWLAAGATIAASVAAAALNLQPLGVLALVGAGVLGIATHRFLLRWEIQLCLIVLTILLIPLGRYELPASLPVHLEPYRLLVGIIAAGWIASLLSDPTMRWRKIGFFGPLLGVVLALLASDVANTARIDEYDVMPVVVKQLSMWASYVVVLLMMASLIVRMEQLDLVVKTTVIGGAIVACGALLQFWTGTNLFDELDVVPLLDFQPNGVPTGLEARGGSARVYSSAQHPIALGAALVMLLPIAIYAGLREQTWQWWLPSAVIAAAAFSTLARTGTTMLATVLLVFLAVKPRETLRLSPALLPLLVVIHVLAPGAIGTTKDAFFPDQGLVAQQQAAHSSTSSNRLADLGPALDEWWQRPYVGYGWGTGISDPAHPKNNALILDNQWLGALHDAGIAFVAALVWLFGRAVRRLIRAARRDGTEHGWLLTALAAAILSCAVGMFTFDAFAFYQVPFLLFALIGLSVPAVRLARQTERVV
jgi:hypothetical protein